jgi:hypothetical protein
MYLLDQVTAPLLLFSALLATDSARAAPPPAPVVSAVPADAPVVSSPAPAAPEPADEPFSDTDRIRGEFAMNTVFAVGLMPTAGLGPGMSLGLRWHYVSFSAEGRFLAPLGNLSLLREGKEGQVMLGMGLLSLCIDAAYYVQLCPYVEAGRFIAAQGAGEVYVRASLPFTMGASSPSGKSTGAST